MLVPEAFHRSNNWLCFVLGNVLNGTLLWLVAKHTTPTMAAHYRPILLFSTLTDLVCLVIYAVVVPVLIVDSGQGVLISIGPLGWILPEKQPYAFIPIALSVFCFVFVLYSQVVPFLYRYFCICHGRKWGPRHFLSLLTLPLVLAVIHVALLASDGCTHTLEEQQEARALFFNESHRQYVIPYFARGSSAAHAHFLLSILPIDYAVVFFCGWRIYHRLMGLAETGQVGGAEYKSLQLQISTALLLQSIVPLFIMFAPTVAITLAQVTGAQARELTVYKLAIDAWLPVVNPLIAMWVIKAYRHAVGRWLKRLMHPVAWRHSSAVHPMAVVGTLREQQPQATLMQNTQRPTIGVSNKENNGVRH